MDDILDCTNEKPCGKGVPGAENLARGEHSCCLDKVFCCARNIEGVRMDLDGLDCGGEAETWYEKARTKISKRYLAMIPS